MSKERISTEDLILALSYEEASQFTILTVEEERTLGAKAKGTIVKGKVVPGTYDEAARNKLVEHNLRYVRSVAKAFVGRGVALTDLIQEGNIGLIKAAERFDPTRGFKFISYAKWWITALILEAISEQGQTIALPANLDSLKSKVGRAFLELCAELEREPSIEELAVKASLSLEELKERYEHIRLAVHSLDKQIRDDDEATLIDRIPANSDLSADSYLIAEDVLYAHIRYIQAGLDKLVLCKADDTEMFISRYGLDGSFSKTTCKLVAQSVAKGKKVYTIEHIRMKIKKIWMRSRKYDAALCEEWMLEQLTRLHDLMDIAGIYLSSPVFSLPSLKPSAYVKQSRRGIPRPYKRPSSAALRERIAAWESKKQL